MKSITEEMRYRRRLCEYAIKYGVTKAARRYHTNRQFVYRQLKKYDGSVRSLAMRSRKPHRSPNAHTEEELSLIKRILKRNGIYCPARRCMWYAAAKAMPEASAACAGRYAAKVTGNRKSTGKVIRTTTGLTENIRGIKYRWILNMFQTNVSGSHAMGSDTVRLPRLINTVGNAS